MGSVPAWREQYDRMERWLRRVTEHTEIEDQCVDDFYAFFTCCFHLKDWLKHDRSLSESIRADVEPYVGASFWLGLCADLANGSKHLELNSARIDPKARVATQGPIFDPRVFHPGVFQTSPIVIVQADGKVWEAKTVADSCVTAWKAFLQGTGLL